MNLDDQDLHYIRLRKGKIVFGFQGEKDHYTFQFGFGSKICDVHKKQSGTNPETIWAARHNDLLNIMQKFSLDELIEDLFMALTPVDYTWLYEGNIWLAESLNEEEVMRQLDKNSIPVAMNNLSPRIRPLPSGLLINRLCQNVHRKYAVFQMKDGILNFEGMLLQLKGEHGQPFVAYAEMVQLIELIERYSEQYTEILNLSNPEVQAELDRYLNNTP